MCIEEKINSMVERFNRRVEKDENLRSYVGDLERRIAIHINDADITYVTDLHEGRLAHVKRGEKDGADIILTTDKATMLGLLDGTIKPMKAYALKKFKLKASLQDILLMKKLLK